MCSWWWSFVSIRDISTILCTLWESFSVSLHLLCPIFQISNLKHLFLSRIVLLEWRISKEILHKSESVSLPKHVKWLAFLILAHNFIGQEVHSKSWVTWLSFAQFVYFLREVCLLFNFWMIKFTIMWFFLDTHTWNFSFKVLYISKNTLLLVKGSFTENY